MGDLTWGGCIHGHGNESVCRWQLTQCPQGSEGDLLLPFGEGPQVLQSHLPVTVKMIKEVVDIFRHHLSGFTKGHLRLPHHIPR